MVPGNPDAISHAYAMEEKKSHDLLKEIQEQITKQGVSKYVMKCLARIF